MANNRKLSQFASAAETPEFINLSVTGVSTFQDNIVIDDGSNSTNQKLALNNNIQSDNLVTILQNGGSNFGDDATVTSIDAVLNYQGTTSFTSNRTHIGLNLDFYHTNSSGHSSANGQRLSTRGVIIDLDHDEGVYNTQSLVVQNQILKRHTDGSNTQIGINNDVVFNNSSGDASGSTGTHVIHGIDTDLTFTGVNDRNVTLYGLDTRINITGVGINTFSDIYGSYVSLSTPSGGTSNDLGDSYAYYATYDYDAAGSYDGAYLYYGNYNNQSKNSLTGERRGVWIAGATHNRLDGRLSVGIVDADDYDSTSNQLVVYHNGTDSPDAGITIVGGATTAFGKIHFADGTTGSAEDVGRIIYDHNTNELQLWTNNSQTMTIDNDGVGIGITNPTKKLEISANNNSGGENNTLRFVDIDTTSIPNQQTGRIEFFTSDTTQSGVHAYILGATNDVDGNGDLRFATGLAGSAEERLRITSDGNIGIGTDNPASPLHIGQSTDNSVTAGITLKNNSSIGAQRFTLYNEEDVGTHYNSNDGGTGRAHIFETGGSEKLRITSDGKLGVKVTSPGCQTGGIHAVHDATEGTPTFTGGEVGIFQRNYNSAQGCEIGIIGGSNSYSRINFGDKDDADRGIISYSHNDDSMRFIVSAAERLRITSAGDVGIASATPSHRLEVAYNDDNDGFVINNMSRGGKFRFATSGTNAENFDIQRYDSANDTFRRYLLFGPSEFSVYTGSTTSATERLSVDSSGRVTIPSQAAALVYKTGTSQGYTSDAIVNYDATSYSQGGMTINNDRNRITVPVAGKYMINACVSGSVTTASSGDGWQLKILRDGSVYNSSYGFPIETTGSETGQELAYTISMVVDAAANDYFEIEIGNVGAAAASISRGYFGIYLLG